MKSVLKKSFESCASLLVVTAILQLTWWPIESAMAECSGADAQTSRNECAAQADKGYTFDEAQCRCVNTAQKEGMRDEFLRCRAITDATQRQQCLADNANNSSALSETGAGDWQEVLGDIQGGVTGIATAMALFNFLGSKDTRPGCASRMIFSATAIVAFAAEVYSYFFLEKKLHDLRDQYKNYVEKAAGGGSGTGAGGGGDAGGLEAETDAALTSGSAYDAQILAFSYLKKEQEIIADVASTKKIAYIIAAVGFGAAMVMAIAEAAVPTMIKCTLNSTTPEIITWLDLDSQKNITWDPLETYIHAKTMIEAKPSMSIRDQMAGIAELQLLLGGHNRSLSLDAYQKMQVFEEELQDLQVPKDQQTKIFALIKSAIMNEAMANVTQGSTDRGSFILQTGDDTSVEDDSLFISLITGVGAAAVMGFSDTFRTWMSSSPGVAIMSGVSMALNIALAAIAAAEEENAKKNAETAQKIKDQFVSSISAYCPNGRENLAEPRCYCYTDERRKNPDRTNSATCQALWARDELNLFKDTQSTGFGGGESPIGCLTVNRQFDADCKCKKFINSKTGQNACYNVPMTTNSLGSMGAGLGLGNTISDLNSLTNGNFNKGSVNQGDLNQRAARSKALGNQLLKNLNDQRAKNKLPLIDLSSKGLANFVNKTLPKEVLDGSLKSKLSPDMLSNQDRPVSDALKDAVAKAGLNNKYEYVGGAGRKKAAEEKKGYNFEMENAGANNSGDAQVMNDFMEKKFNFKDNDIVKNGDASIWQVISNRYTQSALPRLFATDAEIKSMNDEGEKANKP